MSARRDFAAAVRLAFGRVLREARLARGLSQEELAERADLDRTTPSLFERGHRQPTLAVIFLLGRALEIDPRELVGRVMEQLGLNGHANDGNPDYEEETPEQRPSLTVLTDYQDAVRSLEAILLRGLKSIRADHFKRKDFAGRLGLKLRSLADIESGHRRLPAAELLLLAFAMDRNPSWIVQEILLRLKDEVDQWRRETGY